MKKILFGLLLISSISQAQVKEGKVTYERKINAWKMMPPEAEQFKAMVPEFNTTKLELYFNATQSLFKPVEQAAPTMPSGDGGGGGGPRIMFGGPGSFGGGNAETFKDYDAGTLVESRELGPKLYLINDSLKQLKWKLEADTMTINGILCTKATTMIDAPQFGGRRIRIDGVGQGGNAQTVDSVKKAIESKPAVKIPVVAWFANDIATQAGPDSYFGLPGLIMMIDVNDGQTIIKAISIEPVGDIAIKAPTKGKAISRQEYRKMMETQMQGMGGGRGGPGGQRIEVIRN